MSERVTSEPFVPPFQVRAIDRKDGLVVLAICKSLIGTVANHLKVCPEGRKAVKTARKLGHVLSALGNVLYGGDIDDHPDLIGTEVVE